MKRRWWLPLIVVLITLLSHASYIGNGFIWWDHGDIEMGRAIVSLRDWQSIFLDRYGETGYYRPMFTLLHSLNFFIYEFWAPGFHLSSVLLHLGVVLASVWFAKEVFSFKFVERWLVGLIVGVHSLSWFTVGNITSNQELLVSLWLLLMLVWHSKTRRSGRSRDLFFSSLFLLLALWSKETALVWGPGMIVLWELFNKGKVKYSGKKLWLVELTAVLFYLGLRWLAVPEVWRNSYVASLTWQEMVSTRLWAAGKMLLVLVVPWQFPVSDAVNIVGINSWLVWLVLVFSLLGLYVIWDKRIGGCLKFALLLLGLWLAPVLNLVPLPRFWHLNYGYFAVVGIAVLAVLIWRWFGGLGYGSRVFLRGALLVWFGVMALSTFKSGWQLQNDLLFFNREVAKDGSFLEGHYYLGTAYWQRGELELAEKHLSSAMKDDSEVIAFTDKVAAGINLAGVFLEQDKIDEAESLLWQLKDEARGGNQELVIYNLALINFRRGDYVQAVELLRGYKGEWRRDEFGLLWETAVEKLEVIEAN